jgi:folate-binding protein YgfZ
MPGYQAASEGAAYRIYENGGCLEVSGADQATFLQRQTSNDIRLLAARRALLSVLTSPTARILDVFIIQARLEFLPVEPERAEALHLLSLPGRGGNSFRFLKSRVFFMDKVVLRELSEAVGQLDLLGPQSTALVEALSGAPAPPPQHYRDGELCGLPVRLLGLDPAIGLGTRLLFPAGQRAELERALQQHGAAQLSESEYDILRIEAGLPGTDSELDERFTPYEAGLASAVSSSKGCYTGQEVLARQATYDKVTQGLRRLQLSSRLAPGQSLEAEGRNAGVITSAVESPRLGWIGLGVIKRAYLEPGQRLQAGEVEAVVLEGN